MKFQLMLIVKTTNAVADTASTILLTQSLPQKKIIGKIKKLWQNYIVHAHKILDERCSSEEQEYHSAPKIK